MLGIILTGHGGFATGLAQAVEQIIGEQPQFVAIDFPDGMSTDLLEEKMRTALKTCHQGTGVIFLTDILGGSPFRLASMLSFEHPNVEVISGTNMPLLLEMLLQREGLDSVSFREMAVQCAKGGVTSLWHESQKEKNVKESDDGI